MANELDNKINDDDTKRLNLFWNFTDFSMSTSRETPSELNRPHYHGSLLVDRIAKSS
jgi:hypothetical protein